MPGNFVARRPCCGWTAETTWRRWPNDFASIVGPYTIGWTAFKCAVDLLARLSDGQRSGWPCTAQQIIDPLIDAVIEQDPRQFGYRWPVWTASLLQLYLEQAHRIEVSRQSVSLAIARLRVRWKRPRHQLALRPATWRQAKGGCSAGYGIESERSS